MRFLAVTEFKSYVDIVLAAEPRRIFLPNFDLIIPRVLAPRFEMNTAQLAEGFAICSKIFFDVLASHAGFQHLLIQVKNLLICSFTLLLRLPLHQGTHPKK